MLNIISLLEPRPSKLFTETRNPVGKLPQVRECDRHSSLQLTQPAARQATCATTAASQARPKAKAQGEPEWQCCQRREVGPGRGRPRGAAWDGKQRSQLRGGCLGELPAPGIMRYLPFLLLWGLPQVWRTSKALQSPVSLRCLQLSSFANSSWTRTDASAWLGELQTHSWSNDSDTIRFLRPWAQGNISDLQWGELQRLFQVYRSSVTRDIQDFVKMLHLTYPIEVQVSAGCDLQPGNVSESFFHAAFQGGDILTFQGTSWEPAPGAPLWVQTVSKVLNQDKGTSETVQWLLGDTCPRFVSGLLEAGKSDLEKQVKPEAWLSSGPSPAPGRLLLVCHVSGFHPKPVWVMWMRGEQEQPGTQRGDVLPNADETWWVRVTLDVAAGEASGLACRVRHSSLGGQDIILYWDGSHLSVVWITLAVLLFAVLIVGFTWWCRRRRFYQGIP
ncbi:antigen-presenting glycoprotein CD1d isoform X2 [Tamandua tetradactyla]|uniref:antigen-presenting glycoprotein CD1d isoform X2 n=1 Tax=Tamandua tetradactyla TaxID=48850 RepID=UPI00405399E0